MSALLLPEHVVHLRTERLVMRRFTTGDIDILVELDSDPEVTRWVGQPPPPTPAAVEARMPNLLGWYDKGPDEGYWATHLAATGAFIGWFLYRPMREPPGEPELGYRLRRDAWGKGYATEGSRALVARALNELYVPRVVACAMRPNTASTNVMKKIGMIFEREGTEEDTPVDWYVITRPRAPSPPSPP